MSDELKDTQAKQLQQLFQEVNGEVEKQVVIEKKDLVEIDVLSLPPRSEVHMSTKRKMKLTFKTPFGRFMFVLILLILIIAVIYCFFGDEIIHFFTT